MSYVKSETNENIDAVMLDCDKYFDALTEGQDLYELLEKGADDERNGNTISYRESMENRKKRIGV